MRIVRYLAIGLAVQILLSSVSAAELSAAQKREIIFEYQQLVTDYAYYRDLRDAAVAHEPKGEDESAPVLLDNFVVVGKYHDTFVLTDDGWKISERIFRPVFRRPPTDFSH